MKVLAITLPNPVKMPLFACFVCFNCSPPASPRKCCLYRWPSAHHRPLLAFFTCSAHGTLRVASVPQGDETVAVASAVPVEMMGGIGEFRRIAMTCVCAYPQGSSEPMIGFLNARREYYDRVWGTNARDRVWEEGGALLGI